MSTHSIAATSHIEWTASRFHALLLLVIREPLILGLLGDTSRVATNSPFLKEARLGVERGKSVLIFKISDLTYSHVLDLAGTAL
jgi:hypothetical protein